MSTEAIDAAWTAEQRNWQRGYRFSVIDGWSKNPLTGDTIHVLQYFVVTDVLPHGVRYWPRYEGLPDILPFDRLIP